MGSMSSAAESQPHTLFAVRCQQLGAVLILAILAAFGPGGCIFGVSHSTYNDAQIDQPWASPGRQVHARIKVRVDFVRVDEDLVWRSRGREWYADALASQCEQWLIKVGGYQVPREYDSAGREVTPGSTDVGRFYRPSKDTAKLVYPYGLTIVCVEPLVAIVCDDPVEVLSSKPLTGYMAQDQEWFVSTLEHELGDSTFYGTKGKCSSNLRWISPDLNRGPEPLSFSHDGVAIIETSWGHLEVRSDGQQWTTLAVGTPKRK